MSDNRTAIEVLRALNEVHDLGDYVYDIREREMEGWNGPLVTKWGNAVARAKELLNENCEAKTENQKIQVRPMQHGIYIGTEPELRGKTALLMISDTEIKAQFDDVSTQLGHGWYTFKPEEWNIDEECPWQSEQPNEK